MLTRSRARGNSLSILFPVMMSTPTQDIRPPFPPLDSLGLTLPIHRHWCTLSIFAHLINSLFPTTDCRSPVVDRVMICVLKTSSPSFYSSCVVLVQTLPYLHNPRSRHSPVLRPSSPSSPWSPLPPFSRLDPIDISIHSQR